jgi:hypothetical protein
MDIETSRKTPDIRKAIGKILAIVASIIGFLLLCLITWIALSIWRLDHHPNTEGDPGHSLSELSGDPVFATLPYGATDVELKRLPAIYRAPGFTGGGWSGAGVDVTFKSSLPSANVYAFYARQAAAAGWQPTSTDIVGGRDTVTNRWKKIYPDGTAAFLFFDLLPGDRSAIPPAHSYNLVGALDPASLH